MCAFTFRCRIIKHLALCTPCRLSDLQVKQDHRDARERLQAQEEKVLDNLKVIDHDASSQLLKFKKQTERPLCSKAEVEEQSDDDSDEEDEEDEEDSDLESEGGGDDERQDREEAATAEPSSRRRGRRRAGGGGGARGCVRGGRGAVRGGARRPGGGGGRAPTSSESRAAIELDTAEQRKQFITIGLVGHPNAGKSSLINTLKAQKVVSTSRSPGHTKHFQVCTCGTHVHVNTHTHTHTHTHNFI
jgi:50S ribosome-binding GTPase